MIERRTVRERITAQSAMHVVLAAVAAAPPRRRLDRVLGRGPVPHAVRGAYRTALAELAVGEALDRLGPRWDVLHDVPMPGSPLDHLAIGPAGVFAVRAVQCADAAPVRVDEEAAAASEQAGQAQAVLGVPVQPVLVLVGADDVQGLPAWVVDDIGVIRMLADAPTRLTGAEVAAISDLADRPSAWPAADDEVLDARSLHRRFAQLRTIAEEAAQVRFAWVVGVAAVVLAAAWLVTASVTGAAVGV